MWTARFNKGGPCQVSTIEEFGLYFEGPRELQVLSREDLRVRKIVLAQCGVHVCERNLLQEEQ